MRRLILGIAVLSAGCIVEPPVAGGAQPTPAALAPAPPADLKSGANFGDAIQLENVVINPSRGVAGLPVRVAMNFKSLAKLDRDYVIFVHVEDVDGRVDRLNVDHPPRAKPTSQWVPGEMVQDVFDIPIPANMPVRGLSLLIGFWEPQSNQRLPIVNKDQVPNDGAGRLIVAKFPVVPAQ